MNLVSKQLQKLNEKTHQEKNKSSRFFRCIEQISRKSSVSQTNTANSGNRQTRIIIPKNSTKGVHEAFLTEPTFKNRKLCVSTRVNNRGVTIGEMNAYNHDISQLNIGGSIQTPTDNPNNRITHSSYQNICPSAESVRHRSFKMSDVNSVIKNLNGFDGNFKL